jgi:hypothetical protein
MTSSFSGDAISFGWTEAKRHFTTTFLALGALTAALSVLEGSAQRQGQGALHLLLQLIGAFATIGWWRIALRIHDRRPASVRALAETTLATYLQYVVTLLLFWLAVVAGLVLFVVPGVIVAVRLCLAPAIVVDEGLDPISALRRSYELTDRHFAELFVLGLLLGLMNLLGLLALGLGLFITVPTTYLAVAWVYRRLDATSPTHIVRTTSAEAAT